MREKWERQPRETAKAFAAFQFYRDMGSSKRSLRRCAQSLGKSDTVVMGWSTKYSWVERVLAWEDEQDRIRRIENLEEIRETARRQAQEARAVAQALVVPALKFLAKLRQLAADPNPLNRDPMAAWDLGTLLDATVRIARVMPGVAQIEREALGMPARIAVTDVSGMEPALAGEVTQSYDDDAIKGILAVLASSGGLVFEAEDGDSAPDD